jgi:ABC-2 type transport system permease protein
MKMNLQRLKALIKKEFFQITRDPSSWLIAAIFPILLLFLYGYGVSLDINDLKIGVVLQDFSPETRSLVNSLTHSKFFSVQFSQDQKSLEKRLTAGDIHGIVVIPFYFERYRQENDKAPIYVIADGQSPNTASFVQNYVEGAYLNWQMQNLKEKGLSKVNVANMQPRFWYNEELSSHYFLVPGSIALIMTLIGSLLTALVVAREWERGSMEGLIATPMTMLEFLTSKMIAYFCLGMLSMAFCFIAAVFLFHVPYRGSLSLLILVSSVFLIASLAGGLFISTFAKDQFIASQIAIMSSFLPAYSMSGFIFEITSMPYWIQVLAELIPAKYFVSCLQTLFLVGDIYSLIFINLFFLILLSALPIIFTLKRSKKRLN